MTCKSCTDRVIGCTAGHALTAHELDINEQET